MTDDLTLNMDAYLPLRDVVFNTLREAILKGDLKPGERLMELQLAAKLGVSRTPIREAIRKLELEGLVIMIPRKDAEVAHITEKDMKDVLEAERKHLLVKKSDAETSFYYMGQFTVVEARNARKEDNRGRMQPITKVTMKMHHPVREDLLRYLQSNITA